MFVFVGGGVRGGSSTHWMQHGVGSILSGRDGWCLWKEKAPWDGGSSQKRECPWPAAVRRPSQEEGDARNPTIRALVSPTAAVYTLSRTSVGRLRGTGPKETQKGQGDFQG